MTQVVIPNKRRFKKASVVAQELIRKANESTIGDLAFTDFEVTVNRDAKTFDFALTESADKSKYAEGTQSISFTFERATLTDIVQALGFVNSYPLENKQDVINALPEELTHQWEEEASTLTIKISPETTKFGFSEDDNVKVTTFLSTEESYVITFTKPQVEEEEEEVADKTDLSAVLTVKHLNFTTEDLFEGETVSGEVGV